MQIISLFLALAAVYLPPAMAARSRGSRKVWICLIPAGLAVAVASMMLGHSLVGSFDPILFSRSEDISLGRQLAVDILAVTARVSISFCLGSFLAALLYRKHRAASPGLLGLHDRQM